MFANGRILMEKRWGLRPETENIKILGQEVSVNHAENILTIVIHEPFYSAGKKLNWSFENTVGVGVNTHILKHCINNQLQLKICVCGHSYIGNPNKFYKLCRENHWVKRRYNTDLMIIPMALLK